MDLDILENIGAKIYNKHYKTIKGIAYNYTNSHEDYLFVQLNDNMKYLEISLKNGINSIMSCNYQQGIGDNIMQIIHPNPHKIIIEYVKQIRQKYKFQVISVCGTSGKTTVKNLLQQSLKKCIFTNRSCNDFNIAPFYFLLVNEHVDYLVMEVAQYFKTIKSLDQFNQMLLIFKNITIDILIITNINYEHIQDDKYNSLLENYNNVYKLIEVSKKVICNSNIYVGSNSLNEYLCIFLENNNNNVKCKIVNIVYSFQTSSYIPDNNLRLLCITLFYLKIYEINKVLEATCFRGSNIVLPDGTRIIDFSFNGIMQSIMYNLSKIKEKCIFLLGNIEELGFLKDVLMEQMLLNMKNNDLILKVYCTNNDLVDNKKFLLLDEKNLPKYKLIYVQGSRSSQMQNYIFTYINKCFGNYEPINQPIV